MADWLKVFKLTPHIVAVAVNELPGGGDCPALRLEARVFDKTLADRAVWSSQMALDQAFADLDEWHMTQWISRSLGLEPVHA